MTPELEIETTVPAGVRDRQVVLTKRMWPDISDEDASRFVDWLTTGDTRALDEIGLGWMKDAE